MKGVQVADAGRMKAGKGACDLLLGGHMSAAGGLYRALLRGEEHGFTAIQVFLKSPSQWRAKPLTDEDADRFRETLATTGIRSVVAHDSYLINPASPDEELRNRSVAALVDEVDRAALTGIPAIVAHLGAHKGAGEGEGLRLLAESLNRVANARPDAPVKIALETTAGQGTTLGGRFEHLAYVRSRVEAPDRVAACFDTCHVHVAGYDIVSEEGISETWGEFDRVVGVEHLVALHLNDAKRERGSHVDRHEHIGKGRLGLTPFRWIMNSRKLSNVPKIVETPEMDKMHPVNVQRLRSLVDGGGPCGPTTGRRGKVVPRGTRG